MLHEYPIPPVNMDSGASALDALRHAFDNAAHALKTTFNDRLSGVYSTVLATPGTVLLLFVVISAVFAQQGMAFQQQNRRRCRNFPPRWCILNRVVAGGPDGVVHRPGHHLHSNTQCVESERYDQHHGRACPQRNQLDRRGTTATKTAHQKQEGWTTTKKITEETTASFGSSLQLKSSKKSIPPTGGSTLRCARMQ